MQAFTEEDIDRISMPLQWVIASNRNPVGRSEINTKSTQKYTTNPGAQDCAIIKCCLEDLSRMSQYV